MLSFEHHRIGYWVVALALTISGLASADRPPLEALESLTAQLAEEPGVEVAPTTARAARHPARAAHSLASAAPAARTQPVAPVVRPVAPVASDRAASRPATARPVVAPKGAQSLKDRRAQEAQASTDGAAPGMGNMNGWLAIGLVLMVMGAVALWLKKKGASAGLPTAEDIKPLAITRIWGKHCIGLVQVSGRILVVGIGDGGMSLLTELEETDMPIPAPADNASEKERADFGASFLRKLANLKGDAPAPKVDEHDDPFVAALKSGGIEAPRRMPRRQLDLAPLAQSEPAPADELLGLSDERAAIRRRLDALRKRNVMVA